MTRLCSKWRETVMPQNAQTLNNAEIADRLSTLAQLLAMEKANPYKIRAYRRAASTIRGLGESVDELVSSGGDLTEYAGIGEAISGAVREIVLTGTLATLEKLRSHASPELVEISAHPKLDAKRVLRVYKKLKLSSIDELRAALDSGEIERSFGSRMAHHVKQGLIESDAILLYRAHSLSASIEDFLLRRCKVFRVAAVGEYRRYVEVIRVLEFVVQTANFARVITAMQNFGGRLPLLDSSAESATFLLASGPLLKVHLAEEKNWGLLLIRHTGSKAHLRKLMRVTERLSTLQKTAAFSSEEMFYKNFDLEFIPPELREGLDEVEQARLRTLPNLVSQQDIRGDLHVHTVASDGSDSIEEMAVAAKELGYEYVGITDHSQSLTIARGLSPESLWDQIRKIDELNKRLSGIRILKSAEVDILADGSLDYHNDLLRELDYTVCSIHSRFSFGRDQQTERVLRAMDNRYFNILGHATGRLLLKRPGYELDLERIISHAKQNRCFFEINSSPDRLDLSAENARLVKSAGILIAISTDAHSTPEFGTIRFGIEQARRAGLDKTSVLNCQNGETLSKLFAR
jgi:DNA polymerase (family X)